MLFFTGRCQFHLFDKKFFFPLAYIFVKLYYYFNPICTRFCISIVFYENSLILLQFYPFKMNKYSIIYKNAN